MELVSGVALLREEDAVLEARRAVALMVGVGGGQGEGTLGELERGFERVFSAWCVAGLMLY